MINLQSFVEHDKNKFGVVKGISYSLEGIICDVYFYESQTNEKISIYDLKETTHQIIKDYCYKKLGYSKLS